jgi:hypothetical protein
MTRTERIRKLANAVKEYRGVFHANSRKWIRAPKPSKRTDIIRWLRALGVTDLQPHLASVDGFKSYAEFESWIRSFSQP